MSKIKKRPPLAAVTHKNNVLLSKTYKNNKEDFNRNIAIRTDLIRTAAHTKKLADDGIDSKLIISIFLNDIYAIRKKYNFWGYVS